MTEKLQKVLARTGIASRREAERWIAAGRVRVDGGVAMLGDRVGADAHITVDGQPVAQRPQRCRVILYNKPEGEICTRSDPRGRHTVYEALPPPGEGRWVAVGRLDVNTTGLLLFTTDGELAGALMHPRNAIEREYRCRVHGEIGPAELDRLRAGIELDGRPARVVRVQPAGGSGSNRWYSVVVREGRYREVRRLWRAVGGTVSRLVRTRFGPVRLPGSLAAGQWRELDAAAVAALRRQAGGGSVSACGRAGTSPAAGPAALGNITERAGSVDD